MAIRYFCDICGKELEPEQYHMLEITESVLDGENPEANIGGIEGCQYCINEVKITLVNIFHKLLKPNDTETDKT